MHDYYKVFTPWWQENKRECDKHSAMIFKVLPENVDIVINEEHERG